MKCSLFSKFITRGLLSIFAIFILNPLLLRADEGMWLISQILRNEKEMQALGFKLTAEDIYSINHSSMKDAAVMLDDGDCSAEIISSNGLVLTNHHCAIADIQALSSTDHNYIHDGYWAKDYASELPVPGKTAYTIKRIEDVTAQVLQGTEDVEEPAAFFKKINTAMRAIKASVESKEKGVMARVVHMFSHNEYYLFVYNKYTDVRLVGAPPASIGNFGGDFDNWHWPRHTGDFALYRIYTARNGSPADYNKKNIPLKPQHHFPISLKGVNEGDFAMVIGYPGTTYRFSSPSQALLNRDNMAQWIDKYWGEFIATIKEGMRNDEAAQIHYTDTHDGLVNFWQKEVFQSESMKRFKVVEALVQREDSLIAWINRDTISREHYRNSIHDIRHYYSMVEANRYEELHRALFGLMNMPVEISAFFYELSDLVDLMLAKKPSQSKIRREAKAVAKRVDMIYDGYNAEIDMLLYSTALRSLIDFLPNYCSDGTLSSLKEYRFDESAVAMITKRFFERSHFSSPQALKAFLLEPSIDSLVADPLFMLNMTYEKLIHQVQDSVSKLAPTFRYAMRNYTKGIMEMNGRVNFYPDANSTPRVSYGKVVGYRPADAITFRFFTTLDGVVEKNDPSQDVFSVPKQIIELWQNKDYGDYTDSNGQLPVCFLTDNDITGGNSGSPVVNANGHLIGVAFDGNYEAMGCDYAFEPTLQRTISCDIRYVLFVIDKFAGANHLIKEMTIIR